MVSLAMSIVDGSRPARLAPSVMFGMTISVTNLGVIM